MKMTWKRREDFEKLHIFVSKHLPGAAKQAADTKQENDDEGNKTEVASDSGVGKDWQEEEQENQGTLQR